jgi:hypothetical protein
MRKDTHTYRKRERRLTGGRRVILLVLLIPEYGAVDQAGWREVADIGTPELDTTNLSSSHGILLSMSVVGRDGG